MKLPSFEEALKMGKEKLKEALIPVRVSKAKKQAELEMCNIEEEIATKSCALHEECTKENLDFKKIITLQDKVALLERKKGQYGDILKQMFP